MPESIRRLGVLGGTFDPVHKGHLALAEAALRVHHLDGVLFIPSAQPPHKLAIPLAPFPDRYAMLTIGLQGRKDLFCSDMESKRVGPSFTIDTLRQLRTAYGQAIQLYFLIGVDAFAEINTWKEFRKLFNLAVFVVATRPPDAATAIRDVICRFLPDFQFDKARGCWMSELGKPAVFSLIMEPVAVSSTDIRNRAASGLSLAGLVDAEVETYIKEHRLYRC
jgi:nicotinate-nucleotide adenylyltransferase